MERFLIRKFSTSAETNKRQNTSTFASGSSNGVKSSNASGSNGPKWLAKHDSLLVRIDQSCPNKLSSKIACFDLDETLQKTKSGKKPYMTHENDFTFRDASVKEALNALHESGYKIVIFSNQGMVKSAVNGKKAEQIRKRLEIFAKEVRVPALIRLI
jgi:bifunctional polynucleotide phosphatase/kinase